MHINMSRIKANGSVPICRKSPYQYHVVCLTFSSLIYQLLEYEKKLKGATVEDSASTDDEEEWGRRRRMLDDAPSDVERESSFIIREAEALDKAMEERIVARKSSASSITSVSSGVGMGATWRNKYGSTRKRAESVGSNMTINSVISEDLVEEDEEEELLGIGGGFDEERRRSISTETEDSTSASNSPDDEPDPTAQHLTPIANRLLFSQPPPSAPVWRSSFTVLLPPATAIRSTFNVPPPTPLKAKRRPPPIAILPPVPSSPITPGTSMQPTKPPIHRSSPLPTRVRTESKKPTPPPIHIRNSTLVRSSSFNATTQDLSSLATPSQTLFVFPPSPTLRTRTPSTMTLTSNPTVPVPFPSLSTPRVSTFRSHGRTRSFIGLGAGPAPTTAFSKVDARGYVGME
jgi:tyrosine-protein phosphatase